MPDCGRELPTYRATASRGSRKACLSGGFISRMPRIRGLRGSKPYADPTYLGRCEMLDLIIRGGEVVTPQGVVTVRRGNSRRDDRRDRRARCAACAIRATGDRCHGAYRHAGRHRPACASCIMSGSSRTERPWSRPVRSRSGAPRCTAARRRSSISPIGATAPRHAQAIELRDKDFVGQEPVRLGLSHHAALRAARRICRPARGSDPGRISRRSRYSRPTFFPRAPGRMIDFGDIWEAFQVLAKEGGLGVIHAEDNDIVMHMYAKLIREGPG